MKLNFDELFTSVLFVSLFQFSQGQSKKDFLKGAIVVRNALNKLFLNTC